MNKGVRFVLKVLGREYLILLPELFSTTKPSERESLVRFLP